MGQKENERKSLYIIGGVLLILGSGAFLLLKITDTSPGEFLLPCLIHKYAHLYCPGCGGTRALEFFFQGHFLKSLYYHPIVLYGMAVYAWFMVSNTIELLSRGRLKIGMYYKDRYVRIAVGILIVNFIVKNAVLLIFHYPMVP